MHAQWWKLVGHDRLGLMRISTIFRVQFHDEMIYSPINALSRSETLSNSMSTPKTGDPFQSNFNWKSSCQPKMSFPFVSNKQIEFIEIKAKQQKRNWNEARNDRLITFVMHCCAHKMALCKMAPMSPKTFFCNTIHARIPLQFRLV